jgi:hypothetical protein
MRVNRVFSFPRRENPIDRSARSPPITVDTLESTYSDAAELFAERFHLDRAARIRRTANQQ